MSSISAPQADGELDALVQAFVMIVVSEIGDKTFLIAAIMATRHPRVTVFGGAFASLVIMSILSAALGRVILGLIPKVLTLWAAAALFLVFGIKMLQEALSMGSGHMAEEMREVEEELEEDSGKHDAQNPRGMAVPLESLEEGKASVPFDTPRSSSRPSSRAGSPKPKRSSSPPRRTGTGGFPLSSSLAGAPRRDVDGLTKFKDGTRRVIGMLTNPVFAQAFILTFLGEWGDRSQIATIALGGAHSIPVIAFGTILGHGLCTAGAVLGGRLLSTKLSVKHISLGGAIAFLVFALLYSYEAYYTPWGALTGDALSTRR